MLKDQQDGPPPYKPGWWKFEQKTQVLGAVPEQGSIQFDEDAALLPPGENVRITQRITSGSTDSESTTIVTDKLLDLMTGYTAFAGLSKAKTTPQKGLESLKLVGKWRLWLLVLAAWPLVQGFLFSRDRKSVV